MPDECEWADCDENLVMDECELASHQASDCNTNGIIDVCDVGFWNSADCNANLVPDECDIAAQTSLDENENGIPDECEQEQMMLGGEGPQSTMGDEESQPRSDSDATAWEALGEWLETADFSGMKAWEVGHAIRQKMRELGIAME